MKENRIVAVIDIGTSSVRMAVAEVEASGQIMLLESLDQAVSLGRDTFTRGSISRSATEECVRAMRSFSRKLDEYRITDSADIHAVATSAVREASNRQLFVDRIYTATGIDVDIIDEAEVNRYTYLSILPVLENKKSLARGSTLVAEVGGGSTELLELKNSEVISSHTYRLGSLRVREMLENSRAPADKQMAILEDTIRRTLLQVASSITEKQLKLLALGGDARFAVRQLETEQEQSEVARVRVEDMERLAQEVLRQQVDHLVSVYHISYPDAETLGPALLTYVRMAQQYKQKYIYVAQRSLRYGLLAEMTAQDRWIQRSSEQMIHSAMELGRKYDFDQEHAENVARLAKQIFHAMREYHQLSLRYEVMLHVGALLHEIGLYISNRSHHKHSGYLILNSDVFGLGSRDLLLVALIARYHRRSPPRASHQGYNQLDRERRIALNKLASILRVADALDRGHTQRIRNIDVAFENGNMILTATNVVDVSLEQMAMQEKGHMFEQVYGMNIILRSQKTRGS